ncbi:PREDICTED: uncharacterized protein LOC104709588 [Camelina sativa]|uniref:Uncharacterized protein LOC104709588 n=1 Tax=Camelina sativa TaxID=90675 RepID=A0ABM0TD09_CAMSA|nr:PREDICTED: uncharacterized protein LOC104709588 [Camelina sativa]
MVSDARTSRLQPKLIGGTLWKTMVAQWDTKETQERSRIYSNARMSDRNGLGPDMHLSGPTSYQQEEKLGRPVSLGEVFKETHTRPDGTYVDRKAGKIFSIYEKNLQAKIFEIESDPSRAQELTAEDYTAIFLQFFLSKSTEKDSRGNLFGLGSLKDHLQDLFNGKSYQQGESSFVALQEQMKEAHRIIEEQVAYNAKRDAEIAAREA